MRLSLIFELLLIFILIAFAASRVIDPGRTRKIRSTDSVRKHHHHHGKVGHKAATRQQETASKYCSCTTKLCNCCREFNIPVVSLQGPGCASLQYLRGDRLAISMSFGERVLTNTTIDSKKPKPVCMPLPGGVSKFCGRVYNIGRQGDDFNACLGLELRAVQDVEAALRVSCFRFGPKGLKVEPSQPLPVVETAANEEDDEEDDDDDDDDEDDFDFDDVDDDDDAEEDDEDDEEDGDNSVDYGTFSVFDDDFIDSFFVPSGTSSGTKRKKVTTTTTVKPTLRTVTRKTKPLLKKRPAASLVTSTLRPRDVSKTPATYSTTAPVTITSAPTTEKPTTTTTRRVLNRRKPKPTKRVTSGTTTSIPQTITTERLVEPIVSSSTTATVAETAPTATFTTNSPSSGSIALVTSATIVTSENKPSVVEDVSNNAIDGQFTPPKNISSNEVVVSSHESIAAVTAMLQNIPEEVKLNAKPASTIVTTVEDNTTPKEMTGATMEADYSTETKIESTANTQYEASSTEAITASEVTTDSTTLVDATATATTSMLTEDDDSDSEDVTMQSYILKNDEDDEGDTTMEEEIVSTTTVANEDTTATEFKIENKLRNRTKVESKDVLTDIIDGVVDTFGDDDSEENKNPSNDADKDEEDDDDDDDDDLLGDDDDDADEDEDENEEDDEDDDFVARKAKQHQKHPKGHRMRQSRDMWLDRLHW